MLEKIDFTQEHLSKEEYKPVYDALISELVLLQQEAVRRGIGVVVLLEGWNGAGKGSRISDLLYNLDARSTTVHVTPELNRAQVEEFAGRNSGVENFFPAKQEFWEALGPRGSFTFYDCGWYAKAAQDMLYSETTRRFPGMDVGQIREQLLPLVTDGKKGKEAKKSTKKNAHQVKDSSKMTKKERESAHRAVSAIVSEIATSDERSEGPLSRNLKSAAVFERQLVDDGYLVLKFFVHVSEKAQLERLTRLHDNPKTAWRVSDEKLMSCAYYKPTYVFYDSLLEGSNFNFAPWVLVNGEDRRAANLTIAQTLVDALKERLAQGEDPEAAAAAAKARANSAGKLTGKGVEISEEEKRQVAQDAADAASRMAPRHSRFLTMADYPRIDAIDHTLALDRETYKAELKVEQQRLSELEMEMYQQRIPMVIMYEGWDAAGKGGSIKRVAQALDARSYTIFTSPAPTKPELMHPFLWRYWIRLPKAGHVGIYDRSWYGRVLVERVEGFASVAEWSRAYDEINEFEQELVRWGAILLKFWVDISPEEQLNRFKARQADPAKQWKITDEDWRNREKYPQYKAAVEDMFRLTSTLHSPWHVLESDDKMYARIKALKIINEALEARLH
ncbi:MAG: polyphosphate--AMP phosphotransferase [Coriobacteriia bacterium]|nr:polyphosphate--AMP phosphotransferase [Coriobacteriia bacterium]